MAETTTAEKFCTKKVKNEYGEQVPCGQRLKGECRNRKNHVGKYKTGFCSNGFCEGVSVKSPRTGKPMKHCEAWQTCGCQCHVGVDKLFIMTKMPRVHQDMSGYSPPHSPYKMPTAEERALLHAAAKSSTPDKPVVVIESPAPGLVPPTIQREFKETPTGRAGRGQLEYRVKEFCDEYLVATLDLACTPKAVAEGIAKKYGIEPPSQGAVDAVFKRWVALDFAMVASKPTRFIGYTPEGAKLGLEAMKVQAKQRAKSKEAESARTLRPRK
jgi:hypothetical protein